MHELAIAESLITIIKEEMSKRNLTKLHTVKIVHGQISAIVPEALSAAFEMLTFNTPLADASISMDMQPLKVRCGHCQTEFSPSQEYDEPLVIMPCPHCATQIGHEIISGRDLYIDHIEAE